MTYDVLTRLYPKAKLTEPQLQAREHALRDFGAFVALVAPFQVMGGCHKELCRWIQHTPENMKLVLWPRDHGKSRYAAFYAAWHIVKNPAVTIIYGSATAEKAEEMLRFIKSILESKKVSTYFPGLIHPKEGQRKLWNNTTIVVDHPYRTEMGVVDSTIMTCGVGKTIQGKHCDKLILDDVVVNKNNTPKGRLDVRRWFSDAFSIMSAESELFVVGTRHHPKDLYQDMIDMSIEPEYNDEGEPEGKPQKLFAVNQKNVEEDGEFLWPRKVEEDGRAYGFDQRILATKRAGYDSLMDFYSQYYNNPNDPAASVIKREMFQYYDKGDLQEHFNQWTLNGRRLTVYAALDPAFTDTKTADYSAIAIGAIDENNNRYLLHCERFKTDKISKIEERLVALYYKWKFSKLRIESVAGAKMVAEQIASNLKSSGVRVPVDFYQPPRDGEGKATRILATLEPLYEAQAIYHYQHGNASILEDELLMSNPQHDDLKDAWFMCVDFMKLQMPIHVVQPKGNVKFHPRFGGIIS